ncbi:CDP-glycerol glycerophosphotransferase family protein [Fervidibacillus albus]|uniref:CDP-glycerol glycerophosphotransferase family protein n=1 Tax=Fervidibacillus albus TaxID=2980026 RepID=A0A9E8RUL3_9BACI|nr:CDP-glycerol glycerophosphotransferase family protein [Fervidibacillus albus]WAA09705.1 CDP-glycerol glycerophosphotransferase family protein [Fervidibacillus albus]
MIDENKDIEKDNNENNSIQYAALQGRGEIRNYVNAPQGKDRVYYNSVKKITALEWYGSILKISGFCFLEGINIFKEDIVKKQLAFVNDDNETIFSISLRDVLIDQIDPTIGGAEKEKYKWAGFEGFINFSNITDDNKPLPADKYLVYIDFEIEHKLEIIKFRLPLGNIESYLRQGFYSTAMEYFSAKRELKYNLMATYNIANKTLQIESIKLKDYNPKIFQERKRFNYLYRFMNKIGYRILYNIFKILPLQKNKILFASDSRDDLSGNFAFVYNEMEKRHLNFNYHFMLKSGTTQERSFSEFIKLSYHLATAKFIVLDDFYPLVYPLKIRKNAELVQLWHAVGAFKTFGFSRLGRPGGPSPKSKNHRNYTKVTVSSKNVAKHYAEGFGIDIEKVYPTGIPRTDVFFDKGYQKNIRQQLYQEFPFLKEKKVILFAPTFRGNGKQSAHYPINMLNFKKLYEHLKDEYVFLLKIHPFVRNDYSIPYQYRDFFYDFSHYREVNDLLFVTDLLITDYSSVCFEYALLNKPMIFFGFDVEDYIRSRDFYYDFQTFIPGTLVRTTDEMIETIKSKNFNMEKIKPFVNYFFDDLDGNSSKRVVEQIFLDQSHNIK